VDRESAYEKLKGRTDQKVQEAPGKAPANPAPAPGNVLNDVLFGRKGPRGGKQSQGILEAMAKSAARTVGSQVGREIVRGVLGSILGKRR